METWLVHYYMTYVNNCYGELVWPVISKGAIFSVIFAVDLVVTKYSTLKKVITLWLIHKWKLWRHGIKDMAKNVVETQPTLCK